MFLPPSLTHPSPTSSSGSSSPATLFIFGLFSPSISAPRLYLRRSPPTTTSLRRVSLSLFLFFLSGRTFLLLPHLKFSLNDSKCLGPVASPEQAAQPPQTHTCAHIRTRIRKHTRARAGARHSRGAMGRESASKLNKRASEGRPLSAVLLDLFFINLIIKQHFQMEMSSIFLMLDLIMVTRFLSQDVPHQ